MSLNIIQSDPNYLVVEKPAGLLVHDAPGRPGEPTLVAELLKFDPAIEMLFREELTAKELTELKKHSGSIDASKHIPLLRALIRAWGDMRYSPFATIPLEVALIENLRK